MVFASGRKNKQIKTRETDADFHEAYYINVKLYSWLYNILIYVCAVFRVSKSVRYLISYNLKKLEPWTHFLCNSLTILASKSIYSFMKHRAY